jgi:hypothetical protein
MIDWLGLLENALWLLGCALALAVLSYADWAAHISHLRLRDYVKRPRLQAAFNLAGLLFALGLGSTSETILEQLIWLALAVLMAGLAWRTWRNTRRAT